MGKINKMPVERKEIKNDRGPQHKYVLRKKSNPAFFIHEVDKGYAFYETIEGAMVVNKIQAMRFIQTMESDDIEYVKYGSLPEYIAMNRK